MHDKTTRQSLLQVRLLFTYWLALGICHSGHSYLVIITYYMYVVNRHVRLPGYMDPQLSTSRYSGNSLTSSGCIVGTCIVQAADRQGS